MTTLYKFAYLKEQQKIFVMELEAQENIGDYFIPPVLSNYKKL